MEAWKGNRVGQERSGAEQSWSQGELDDPQMLARLRKMGIGPSSLRKESIARMREKVQGRLRQLEESRREDREGAEESAAAGVPATLVSEEDRVALSWLEGDVSMEEETVYLYVSSRNRDRVRWPKAGHYRIDLNQEINNVIEVGLVQYTFPLTDPVVREGRSSLRFSYSPPGTVYTIQVPFGNYSGSSLATEVTRQMNMAVHEAAMLSGTYTTEASGLLQVPGSSSLASGLTQVLCRYLAASHRFVFQLINEDRMPVSSPELVLYVDGDGDSDVFGLMGFDRSVVKSEGALDVGSGLYTLGSGGSSVSFNPGTVADPFLRHGVMGNKSADLADGGLLFLDIGPLNDNDVLAPMASGGERVFDPSSCFAVLNSRGVEATSDRLLTSQSSSFPAVRKYREGRSRVNFLEVVVRRSDGSVADFGGAEHFIALRLKVKRFQPKRSVFTR